MSGTSLLFRDEPSLRLPPLQSAGGDDAPVAAWLRRALSCQYDAVLAEDLPPAMIALARTISGEH